MSPATRFLCQSQPTVCTDWLWPGRYFLPGLRGSGGGGYAAMAGAKPLGEALRLNAERSLQPEAEGPRL